MLLNRHSQLRDQMCPTQLQMFFISVQPAV